MYSVLYIDDETDLLEICKYFLEETGQFVVDTTDSARVGLELLKTRSFDTIISDYQMPEMNGIEFLKNVRRLYGDIPFILFTGKGREDVVIDAINNGADFYLQKGADTGAQFAELMHKIRQALLRKKAEKAIKESEQKYRDLVEHSTDIIYTLDFQGNITSISPALTPLLGYQPYEVIGQNFRDYVTSPSHQIARREMARKEGNEISTSRYEIEIRSKGGNIVPFEINSRTRYRDGKPFDVLGIARDITQNKRANEILRQSEELFRSLVEQMQDSVVIVSFDGTVLYANPSTLRLAGITRDDLLPEANISDFIDPVSHSQAFSDLKAISEGNKPYIAEYQLKSKKNEPR